MKLKIKEKIVAEMPQKETCIEHMQDTILKRYLYLTQKSGFVNTKSRKNVHKYSFSFYTYITYLF